MKVFYENVTPIIPNTIMEKVSYDGTARIYEITPCEGYETHHCARCWEEENPDTGEKTFVHGYSTASCTVPLDYDFEKTKEVDGHIAYGEKEIFARKIQSSKREEANK